MIIDKLGNMFEDRRKKNKKVEVEKRKKDNRIKVGKKSTKNTEK